MSENIASHFTLPFRLRDDISLFFVYKSHKSQSVALFLFLFFFSFFFFWFVCLFEVRGGVAIGQT